MTYIICRLFGLHDWTQRLRWLPSEDAAKSVRYTVCCSRCGKVADSGEVSLE